ncbi:unnamed protein product, partial [Rotaria sp. Silwood2]
MHRAILLDEIKRKKYQLTTEHHHYNHLKSETFTYINNHIILIRVNKIIDNFVSHHQKIWTTTHQTKLTNLRFHQNPRTIALNPPQLIAKSVKNFSNRILTTVELEALSNGLDYVYPSTKYDYETFISSIECLFVNLLGYCTDKHDYDEKDSDEIPEYKMTPKQLQYAFKLRNICDNFNKKAHNTPSKSKVNNSTTSKILLSLSKDKSIYITRPDKGRGIVVMNRTDYISKMNNIINDPTTFKLIPEDCTIKQEDRLIRKLRKLKETKFISDEEFKYCYPTGSIPARMYGLPKIHKTGLPLRPILSASGTYNYKLAKFLVRRLSHLRKHKILITDTFLFVDELHKLKFNMKKHRMISFDVVNLFTNVPLNDTIEIILDQLYGNLCQCKPLIFDNTQNIDTLCKTCENRTNMKWLLETATTKTHFYFNGQYYLQIDGVAIGSPLGPLLADIYLIHLEQQLMKKLKSNGLVYWKRYVDDTFAIVRNKANAEKLKTILNSFHPKIQFTYEEEKDNQLSFLDINITHATTVRCSQFSTTIYRKPSYTGLILKWTSFVPTHYKKSALSSMIYRAIRICSTHSLLHDEFMFIKDVALANGYPVNVIEQQIRKTLDRFYAKQNKPEMLPQSNTSKTIETKLSSEENTNKKEVLLIDIPYVGRPTTVLGKRLINLASNIQPHIHLQPIPRPPPSLQALFPRKDPIPNYLQSHLVYNIKCNDCDASYIGKTNRQAIRRFREHGAPQEQLIHTLSSPSTSTIITLPLPSLCNLRRSDRNKNKIINYFPKEIPICQPELTIKSAIYDHKTEFIHTINWKNWRILAKDSHSYRLLIKESLAIQQQQPKLNKTISSIPLIVFPDGLTGFKPK